MCYGTVRQYLHVIKVTVSPRVDSITIEYGYDASPLYPLVSRRLAALGDKSPSAEGQKRQVQSNRYNETHVARRRLAEDPFFVFGGTIQGENNHGSHYIAQWTQKFHVLVEPAADKKSEIYVFENEDGTKTFPCIYFPNGNMTTAQVMAMGSLDDATGAGGEEGRVLFDSDSGAFTLYSNETVVSHAAGGQFVPDIYVSGSIPGSNATISSLYGGINGIIFDWTPTSKFAVATVSAKDDIVKRGVETMTLDIYATNENLNDFAFALFDVDSNGKVELADEGFEGGTQRNRRPSSAGVLTVGSSIILVTISSLLIW
ncbi:MAG: hypothetical protein SGBAC_009997 [Bacillariaceae sp.]